MPRCFVVQRHQLAHVDLLERFVADGEQGQNVDEMTKLPFVLVGEFAFDPELAFAGENVFDCTMELRA